MWKAWCKIFVIYILLVLSADLCVQAQKATSKDAKPKIDEKKLKEIAAIRDKLNKAFEKDMDMKTVGGPGVIVQPGWTQADGKSNSSTKVVVTQKNLKDAAAIRDEIQNAINTNTYVKGDAFNASDADHYLGIQHRSKNVLSKMVGSSKDTYTNEEVGYSFETETEAGLPNVVDSSALEDDIDLGKLKRLEMSSRRTREVLVLTEIVEDLSFDLGEDVNEWEHFQHDGQEYFIGLRDTDLLIIRKDAMKYEKGQVVNVGAPILHLETYSLWNTESRQQEGWIVVAIQEKVLWFQVTSNEPFWQWTIGIPINGLRYFKINQKNYLAVSSDQSSTTESVSLNIYQFDVKTKEFWIAQKLQLEYSSSEIAFLDTGRDVVLAAVQNNAAVIFTFNPRSEVGDHIKFELTNTIESEGIQSVSGFQMGGYSYLALGGLSPQILHYTRGEFVPKTILGQNFGLVEMFLAVPARTYRDDLILLVQHRVDFESHDLVVLDTLIWDGEVFEATAPAPCIVANRTISHGVSCMLDVQRDTGIKGSAILKRENDIFIIVPRHKTESGLFELKTELLAKNSELLDLQEIFDFLKEWVKEQEDLVEEAHKFLEESHTNSNKEPDFSNLVSIKASELDFSGDIGKIFVNEYEWTDGDMQVDLEDLIGAIERLDMELGDNDAIVRNRRELTYDTLDFDNVYAEDFLFHLLNGEQPYLKDSELTFDGTVSFESLKVLNEIRLSSARIVRDDSMEVDGDIKFEEINGVVWNDLIADMVFRSSPLELEELQVVGEVIVERDMTVSKLNNIRFPDDYLWSSGPISSRFEGEKNFHGSLTANAVDTGGLINGVNPFDVITLSETQNISGLTVFTQLEVSERMEVNGSVHGRGLADFLSNPSLLESNIIHSACTFHNLEVRGPIHISDKFNDIELDTVLNDIVYLPSSKSEQIPIRSKKSFNSVLFDNLELKDNLLNGIHLQKFVTKNTEQELDLKSISGNVYFNNLTVTKQYDSVDVNQLIASTVNIDEDRIINAEIEFVDDVWAHSIEILDSLNNQHHFIALEEDLELEEAVFSELVAPTCKSECDITGDGTINNMNLKDGRAHQTDKLYVDELILESGLQVESLHNINTTFLLSFLEKVDNIPAMILNGKILVDHIHVDGDIQLNKLNTLSFDEDIQMSIIWLNRPNFLQTKVEFQEPILLGGDLRINGSLNEFDFPTLVQDIAFKSDNPVTITADKRFLTNFKVLGDADMDSINGLPLLDIATKQTMEQFQGTVHINGDLLVESLEVIGFLNDYPLGSFAKSYRYDEDLKSIVLLGEVVFEGHINLENLHIHGNLNPIGNVNEFFENIVYRNKLCMLKGKTTFVGNVTIEKGAYIRNLNGYNVAEMMKNIVFINDSGPIVISAPVLFKDVIRAKDMTVKGSLNATNLMGCSLREWMTDTLRVDRAADIGGLLVLAEGVLEGNSLYTVYLNGMDLDYVVTLYTSQNISGYVSFSDVYLLDSISSGGLVNGINLLEEMENTLMTNGNQYIATPLTMKSCHVIQSLETKNIVNESKDLRHLAILHDNLDFYSPIFFAKVTAQNVITNDLISGIDFNQWHQYSLWTETRNDMVVAGNWTIRDLYVHSPSVGDYLMNGDTMDNMKKALSQPSVELKQQYAQLYKAFAGLCHRSKELFNKAQNRIYFLKHIEKSFSLQEDEDINGVFSVSDTYHNYLILNIKCQSKVFLWDVEHDIFKKISEFESGLVKEIVALPSKGDTIHLVTNVQSQNYGCPYMGVNSWHFDQERVTHLKSFNDVDISMIHHPSQSPDKFYAIDERTGKVLQLTPNSSERHSWNLPPSDSGLYRFLPHDADLGIALANGQQILLLNEPSRRRMRSKRDSLVNRQVQHEFEARSELVTGKELNFNDFRNVIERTLRDLIRRLNVQLTDINWALSEGELQDEHLHRDFMDILEEIYEQKILSSDTVTDLRTEIKELSSNPVQIVAARVVLVIWPVLNELEEVHSHLRTNNHDHPICTGIFNLLRSGVHDILQIAQFLKKDQTDSSDTTGMTAFITRIKDFQKEILEKIDNLDKEHHLDVDQLTDTPPSSPEAPIQVHLLHINTTAPNPLDEPFIGHAILERNLLAADSPHLPARGAGEIVSIKTGMSGNYRTLIAITEPKDHVIDGENNSVKIFFDVITGSLFQTLSAYKPSCLTAARFLDESLLAFVEDKYMIRVLTYKGIRGFVEFVRFKVDNEVISLNFVSVPVKREYGCSRNFLMVSGGSQVDFFDVIMTGKCDFENGFECSEWDAY